MNRNGRGNDINIQSHASPTFVSVLRIVSKCLVVALLSSSFESGERHGQDRDQGRWQKMKRHRGMTKCSIQPGLARLI